jgi:AbrB family looped-hinge helix DNA binding protein
MARAEKLTTTVVSTKGQVILPSAIRQRREWRTGTRLVVEETAEGVLLKPAPAFAETRPKDVFASLPHRGRPKTLEEMEAGVLAEARRRHARD